MDWGHQKLYPNFYIILCGPSGRARKGTAMGLGKDLIRNVKEVRMVSESVTREGLIKAMQNAQMNFIDPQYPQSPQIHCSITIFSDELAVFLGQADLKFLSNLTDWYDSADKWTYETKGGGKEEVAGMCVNLLGATAPDWLQSILPQEAVGGGFTSRVIFIVEETKGKTIPNPTVSEESKALRGRLIQDLEQVVTLAGPMEFTETAQQMYEEWYQNEDTKIANEKPPIADPRFAGYCERRPTHIKKLAMIMSVSRGNDMIITDLDFSRAKEVLESAEVKMVKTFGGLGASRYGQITQKIMEYIITNSGRGHVITRSQLMKTFYTDVDPETLEVVSVTLEQMNIIKRNIDATGEVRYELI